MTSLPQAALRRFVFWESSGRGKAGATYKRTRGGGGTKAQAFRASSPVTSPHPAPTPLRLFFTRSSSPRALLFKPSGEPVGRLICDHRTIWELTRPHSARSFQLGPPGFLSGSTLRPGMARRFPRRFWCCSSTSFGQSLTRPLGPGQEDLRRIPGVHSWRSVQTCHGDHTVDCCRILRVKYLIVLTLNAPFLTENRNPVAWLDWFESMLVSRHIIIFTIKATTTDPQQTAPPPSTPPPSSSQSSPSRTSSFHLPYPHHDHHHDLHCHYHHHRHQQYHCHHVML